MDDSQKLNFLAGQFAAFQMFALALINTHNDLDSLSAEVSRLMEVQEAVSAPTSVQEEYLEGQRQVAEILRTHIDYQQRNAGNER